MEGPGTTRPITLHQNATTTPAIRAAMQQARGSDYALARPFNVSRDTLRNWRQRDTVADGSHPAHRLQTTLNAAQEERVIDRRTQLLLPRADLLGVVREFIEPAMSRLALDRLLRRRGHSRLPVPDQASSAHKPCKADAPGYVHIDLKYLQQLADETAQRYVVVAIDRATHWVFTAIKGHKTAAAARAFLKAVHQAAPLTIKTVLTDNGKELTDRLVGHRAQEASGQHEFDARGASLGMEHRLTTPKTPPTHGMVERCNGRWAQVLRSHHFNSADDLERTLLRYVWLYNQHLPQKALNHETPVQALKRWRLSHPHLFSKIVRNHAGPDTYTSR